MKRTTARLTTSVTLALGLALATATAVAAQKPTHGHASAHAPNVNKPSNPDQDRAKDVNSFRGVAKKLGTTPDALETDYLAARQANPKLTHGQFVAANMVAHNLSAKNPNITTQAILDGLKSGKSIGQTVQSLGLSEKEAKEAEASAKREAKQAEHDADKAEKTGGQ
ncbi:MAG TPA: hypothetical protein VK647_10470 [Gemmatimonadales bacterium]|jgi:hypothetical protein|nr:hypothetical protein [Gemmatimonadales bacterium]